MKIGDVVKCCFGGEIGMVVNITGKKMDVVRMRYMDKYGQEIILFTWMGYCSVVTDRHEIHETLLGLSKNVISG